jgi:hypothetical protein
LDKEEDDDDDNDNDNEKNNFEQVASAAATTSTMPYLLTADALVKTIENLPAEEIWVSSFSTVLGRQRRGRG